MTMIAQRIWHLLPLHTRKYIVAYVPLSLVGGALDLLGVALALPFLVVVTRPNAWDHNAWVSAASTWLGIDDPRALILSLGFVLLAAIVAREGFGAWLEWYRTRFMTELQGSVSERLLETYLTRGYRFFLSRHSVDLGQNVLVRVNRFITGLVGPALSLVRSALTLAVLFAGLAWFDARVAVLSLAVFAGAQMVIFRRLQPWLMNVSRELRDLNTLRFRTTTEALQGIREAKLLGCESYFLDAFARQNQASLDLRLRRTLLTQLPRLVSRSSLLFLVVAAALYLVGTRQEDRLGPLVIVYVLLVLRVVPQVQACFAAVAGLASEHAVLEEIEADLVGGPDGAGPPPSAPLRFDREIALDDVHFRYRVDRPPTLSGINLTISRGTRVAIVGRTGAGKTTLLDILTGLLPPDAGAVIVDGDRQPAEPLAWRRLVGYVSQETYLVDATLAQNVAFGVAEDDIDRALVKEATRAAALDRFIEEELPRQYETAVGERGVSLSRGQRQRVGIARALYRHPAFLVLDEATNSLDPATERQVLKNLADLEPQPSVVLVTHRLQTAATCDEIVVLDGGRLVGRGSEAELRASCPEFTQLTVLDR